MRGRARLPAASHFPYLAFLKLFVARLGFTAAVLAGLWTGTAAAFQPFTVRDIRIEGAQRIEPGTVFGYLPVKVGERFTEETASAAVKALFASGFFRDVRLQVDGDVLVVVLEERPAIGSVDITGSKEFDKETLRRVLRDLGLAESRIFDRSLLERAEQELKRQYLTRGRYAAQVTTTVTPLERNRVGIVLAVEEGEAASIAAIRFVGNRAFSEKELLGLMKLSTPTWISWYTRADQYSREKLSADLETLRSFYLDRGYLEFNVRSTQVAISPDKQEIELVVAVEEGERFQVSGINFSGDLQGREGEYRELLLLKPGETFSGSKLNQSTDRILDRLGGLGFAFADVRAVPNIDREKRQVEFDIAVDPGRRAYVRRINITGNTRTRDEVVRRELRQFEDAWYDAGKIRLSRERIGRLGYFTDVRIETQAVPEAPDQVDLNVTVAERATGALTLGVGFSSVEKFIISGSINQQNFLGTGKALSVDVNTSKLFRTISMSFVDPYFTEDGVSRSFDVYTRTFNARELNLGDYRLRSNGLGMRFGIPYTEVDRLTLGVSAEENEIRLGQLAPPRYVRLVDEFGPTTSALLSNVGWIRDSRDSALTPTRGWLQRANVEVTLPVAELRYLRSTYATAWYYPITRSYTLALSGDVGVGRAFGDNTYPLFKNFYAGGIGSVRGFYSSSLGPKDVEPLITGGTRQVPLGGTTRIVGSGEFLFPLPGVGAEQVVRSFVFMDVGNVFTDTNIDFGELRASTGIGINWYSPIGPMKLSVGRPVRSKPEDRRQAFQFQIGGAF